MNTRILFVALLVPAVALAAEPLDITKDWQAMPVKAAENADVSKVLPEKGDWKDGAALEKKIPLAEGAKAGNNLQGEFNAWYRRSVEIPKEWLAGSVRFEQQLNYCDLVVFVNGKKAGVAFHPDGAVELAPFLRAGKNEIKVFATNRSFGTGEKRIAYQGRDEALLNAPHFSGPARLVPRSAAFVEDVYAEPSWREKKLTVRVSIHAAKDRTVDLAATVAEKAGGPAVKSAERKGVKVKAGDTEVALEIPWENPVPWEPVPNAKLYACAVAMTDGGAPADAPAPVLFGFREIWREGKEILLNGHVQRFRGFWDQGFPQNAADVHRFGFNLAYRTHRHESVLAEDPALMERLSRAGVAVFAGMPTIYYVHEAVRRDPDCEAQWRRHLRHWMRTARNWPCIVAASCGVNQICPERNMRPEILGQDPETGGVVENIEFARRAARELHPNCLYFSHADGTEADLSSSNLYFNFTPLQEREEWLSSWATNGILPWYAAEFGAPYYACWFHSRVPQMTEWLAAYYGDAAYAAESEDMLRHSKEFAKSCLRSTHGGWVDKKDLYAFNELGEEYSRMLVRRTNRAWRAFGLNGGLMYLISWKWQDGDRLAERQRLANGDLVTFLGGAPDFVDRTHAYRAGETIEKQLVFVWDGLGKTSVRADWKLVETKGGKVLASGSERVELAQGDIVKKPLSVKAPDVRARTACRFEVAFDAPGIDPSVKTDSFDVEIFPAAAPTVRTGFKVALYDPEGDTAAVLDALGVRYEKADDLAAAIADEKVQALVVGRHALSHACGLEAVLPRVEKGLRVFVAQQDAATWQAMGFTVEDSMARQMFNVGLHGIEDADLAHWRGEPMADAPFGNVMKHDTRRGPRWTHRHAVSATPLLIPARGGFRPLVRGEFDMSYSPLLRAVRGSGAVTFCALDFEGRVGGEAACPAATAVAAAAFENFFADKQPFAGSAKAFYDGAHAKRLADALGLDAAPYAGGRLDGAVLLVGKDSALSKPQVESALGRGTHVLVLANDRLAKEAGLAAADAQPAPFFRAPKPSDGAFGGLFAWVGPSLLRWRDEVSMLRLSAAGGYKVAGDGEFALSASDSILFDSVDPFQACDRYGDKAADIAHGGWGRVPKGEQDLYLRNASQSEDNAMRRLALMLGRWGVGAGRATLGRALYTKPAVAFEPIAQYNVLGPWPSPKDDSNYMVDGTVDGKPGPFPVDPDKKGDSGATAEEMAIRGDVQPNPRFRPLHLDFSSQPKDFDYIDWRPVVKSNPDGLVEYSTAHALIAEQSFCTCYCVGYLPRETDGEITLRFGVDWRGKVWVNGKEVCKTYGGAKDEGSIVVEHIPVWGMGSKDDAKHGTFDGKNVITVKAGCGQGAKVFYLNVSREVRPGELVRTPNPAYDGTALYASRNPKFDPYEYVYW